MASLALAASVPAVDKCGQTTTSGKLLTQFPCLCTCFSSLCRCKSVMNWQVTSMVRKCTDQVFVIEWNGKCSKDSATGYYINA